MGLLRLLLALAVVMEHTRQVPLLPGILGANAVSIFFVISGFYMSLVLNGKYEKNRTGRTAFFKARVLRLFPAYWIVLSVCAIGVLATHRANSSLLHYYSLLSLPYRALAGLSQVVILGTDVLTFSAIDPGAHSIVLVREFRHAAYPAFNLLLDAPVWSLSVELLFYAVAPFLVTRNLRWTGVWLIAALAIRFAAKAYWGLDGDPWEYRFFPFELNLFLAGSLAHQLYARYRDSALFQRELGLLVYPAVYLAAWSVALLKPDPEGVGLCASVFIPFFFHATRSLKVDRAIGELSYPIYICHYPMMMALGPRASSHPFVFMLGVLAVSLGLTYGVDLPIDRIRQRMTRQTQAEAAVDRP